MCKSARTMLSYAQYSNHVVPLQYSGLLSEGCKGSSCTCLQTQSFHSLRSFWDVAHCTCAYFAFDHKSIMLSIEKGHLTGHPDTVRKVKPVCWPELFHQMAVSMFVSLSVIPFVSPSCTGLVLLDKEIVDTCDVCQAYGADRKEVIVKLPWKYQQLMLTYSTDHIWYWQCH